MRRIPQARQVEFLEQAFFTATQQFGAFDFDHVPAGMTRRDHRLDLRQLAVVFASDDVSCTAGVEGLEVGLVLGLLGGATKGNHGQALGRGHDAGTQ
ncbi:hypothetical protein D3C71_1898080 [compost metagenome]